jgi:hypothetical protein
MPLVAVVLGPLVVPVRVARRALQAMPLPAANLALWLVLVSAGTRVLRAVQALAVNRALQAMPANQVPRAMPVSAAAPVVAVWAAPEART